jgi:hypothetical protein
MICGERFLYRAETSLAGRTYADNVACRKHREMRGDFKFASAEQLPGLSTPL